MKHSNNINYLRLFTALTVLITHFGTPEGRLKNIFIIYDKIINIFFWSNKGLHFGVIIFVVLSGFLIHRSSRFTNRNEYLIKRIVRIYPLFFISSFAGLFINGFNDLTSYFLNISLVSSIIPNIGPPGNPILLTVIVEIVIYILYIKLRKFNTYKVSMILFLIYIINFIVYLKFDVDSTYIERNLFSLLFYWYIGASACEFFVEGNKKINYTILILAYLIYLIFSNIIHIKGIHYLYSIIFAVLASIFIAVLFKKDLNNRSTVENTKLWLLSKMGETAYSIYAWHFIILNLFQKKGIEWNTKNYFFAILITILISFLSYNLIEKYFNNKRFDIINYFKNRNFFK